MLTQEDKDLLAKKGISEAQIAEQLNCFEKGFPYLKLAAAASVANGGIMTATEEEQQKYLNAWDSYKQGDKLRIINTANADGFLWGQVAASAEDATPVGWVALMYTNFESVKESGSSNQNSTNVVARAVVTAQGYLNVRSDAGTDNQIVGALSNGTQVDLYETKYVNGIQWGRYSGGWICRRACCIAGYVPGRSGSTAAGRSRLPSWPWATWCACPPLRRAWRGAGRRARARLWRQRCRRWWAGAATSGRSTSLPVCRPSPAPGMKTAWSVGWPPFMPGNRISPRPYIVWTRTLPASCWWRAVLRR